MNDNTLISILDTPLSLVLVAAICVASFLAYRGLSRQWRRPGALKSARAREIAALGVVTLTALLLVAVGTEYKRRSDDQARLLAEMKAKTALAAQISQKTTEALDAARVLLADRALEKIAQQQLTQARAELARFASFNDPRIIKMIELLDKELEIRKLVQQGLSETAPQALYPIYSRLAELVPDNAEYREKAARYAPVASADAGARDAAPAGAPGQQGTPSRP